MSDDDLEDRLRALDADGWKPPTPPRLALPEPPTTSRRRRRLTLRPAVALMAVALAVIAGALGEAVLSEDSPPTNSITLTALTPGDPTRAYADVVAGSVRLHVRDARPTPPGHLDELWFMTDERRLVSVGTFRIGADGRADVRFDTAADPRRYRYVDVSLEPDDGNPEHSDVSILRSAALR